MNRRNRRRFLKTIAATTTVGLVGCSGGDGDGGSDRETDREVTTVTGSGDGDDATTTGEDVDGSPDGTRTTENTRDSGEDEDETVVDEVERTEEDNAGDDQSPDLGQESWPQYAYDSCWSRYAPDVTFPSAGPLEMKWEYSLGGDERWRKAGGLILGAGLVIASWAGPFDGEANTVVAIDEATGEQAWAYESDHEMTHSVFHDGVVYTANRETGNNKLVAIDAATGNQLWSEPGILTPDLFLRDGATYTDSTESVGIKRFDLSDGTVTELPDVGSPIRLVGDHIYTGDSTAATDPTTELIQAYDAESGAKRWEVEWEVSDTSPPAL
jgi:glucose dehydrogenase